MDSQVNRALYGVPAGQLARKYIVTLVVRWAVRRWEVITFSLRIEMMSKVARHPCDYEMLRFPRLEGVGRL